MLTWLGGMPTRYSARACRPRKNPPDSPPVYPPVTMEPSEPQKFKTRKRREGGRTGRLINFTCYHNQPLLASARCCVWTLHAIDRARTLHGFRLWAYCLMPNHVHLLLRPAEGTLVSSILTSIKQSVANQAIAWTKKYAPHFLPSLTHTGSDGR